MLARDRERREIILPKRFAQAEIVSLALNIAEEIDCSEPKSYKEAITSPDKEHWIKVMSEKLESLAKNNTWVLVDKLKGVTCFGCKWILKGR